MKKIVLTAVVTLLMITAGFIIYIRSGIYDISQLTPHNSITKSIIRTTTHSSIDARIKGIKIPGNINDSSLIIEGFTHYNEMCVACHGAPGTKPSEMTEGLYPKPPQIYKHKKEEDPAEFFWIIKNGIKMTSMPAYGPTHSDEKIWAITAFVTEKLNKMSEEEYAGWSKKYGADMEMDDSGDKH